MIDVIKGWNGFEQPISNLHKTGDKISVERNIKVTGK
jgi:hypothetical protein